MRPIDADAVCERCRKSGAICTGSDCEIPTMPTLTPPNELLTCEGCACEEYRRDTYPCNCCARNDETISDQYRPPEGEEDT